MNSNFYSFIHTLVLHILDLRLKFVHQGHKGQGQDIHFIPLWDVPKLVMRNVVSVEQIPAKTNSLKEIWVYDLETCLSRSWKVRSHTAIRKGIYMFIYVGNTNLVSIANSFQDIEHFVVFQLWPLEVRDLDRPSSFLIGSDLWP